MKFEALKNICMDGLRVHASTDKYLTGSTSVFSTVEQERLTVILSNRLNSRQKGSQDLVEYPFAI